MSLEDSNVSKMAEQEVQDLFPLKILLSNNVQTQIPLEEIQTPVRTETAQMSTELRTVILKCLRSLTSLYPPIKAQGKKLQEKKEKQGRTTEL